MTFYDYKSATFAAVYLLNSTILVGSSFVNYIYETTMRKGVRFPGLPKLRAPSRSRKTLHSSPSENTPPKKKRKSEFLSEERVAPEEAKNGGPDQRNNWIFVPQKLGQRALTETTASRESSLVDFTDVCQQLRDDTVHFRRNLGEKSSKSIPRLAEALDFKKVLTETKAQATAIDLELMHLEATAAALHVQYLTAFMPDDFMQRGGDNDALLVLLLVSRLTCKAELLLTQVCERLIPPKLADGGEALSSDLERYAFFSQFCFLLYTLLSELHRWAAALNTCTAEDFLKIGILLSELSIQEKSVDFYLELLRKSQLDENIPLDGLETCISSVRNFYSTNLFGEQVDASILVSDLCLASAAASDCIVVDVNRLIYMLRKSEKESNVAVFLQDVKTIGESIRQLAKRTRRYVPDAPKQPPVSHELQSQLLNDCIILAKVVKILQEACKQAVRHAGILPGSEGIPSSKVEKFLQAAMEKCDSRAEGSAGIKEVVKKWLTTLLMTMSDLAQVVNEAPGMPKEKPPTPLTIRSRAVKFELDQTTNFKIQLENKEATIKDLKKVLRAKQDELSEASIRKKPAGKKFSTVSKDNEIVIEKLTRKLDDVTPVLQRKEREVEATLANHNEEFFPVPPYTTSADGCSLSITIDHKVYDYHVDPKTGNITTKNPFIYRNGHVCVDELTDELTTQIHVYAWKDTEKGQHFGFSNRDQHETLIDRLRTIECYLRNKSLDVQTKNSSKRKFSACGSTMYALLDMGAEIDYESIRCILPTSDPYTAEVCDRFLRFYNETFALKSNLEIRRPNHFSSAAVQVMLMLTHHFQYKMSIPVKSRFVHSNFQQKDFISETNRMITRVKKIRDELKAKSTNKNNSKQFRCGECEESFKTQKLLRFHAKKHSEDAPTCGVCGQKFRWQSEVNDHSAVHLEKKPFSCLACGRSYTRKWNLKMHKCVTKTSRA